MSYEDRWEMERAQKADRIAQVSDRVAHLVLMALCKDSVVQSRTLKLLDKFGEEEPRASSGSGTSTATGSKRKADDELLVCENCDGIYDEADNDSDACNYHEGNMEADYDCSTWDDWDEKTFGPIDRPDNREAYPEGFMWDCCERQADDPEGGCVVGRHIPVAGSKKRRADDDLGICTNCSNFYNETHNGQTTCQFHEGRLEPDDDHELWDDYEEWRDGPDDSDYLKNEWPDAYRWSCCGRQGDDPAGGCIVRTQHVSLPGLKKAAGRPGPLAPQPAVAATTASALPAATAAPSTTSAGITVIDITGDDDEDKENQNGEGKKTE